MNAHVVHIQLGWDFNSFIKKTSSTVIHNSRITKPRLLYDCKQLAIEY